jgi:uncharacterized membrane protein YedE/YeeE
MDPLARYADYYSYGWNDPHTINGLYRAAVLAFVPVGAYISAKQSDCLEETFVRDYYHENSKHYESKRSDLEGSAVSSSSKHGGSGMFGIASSVLFRTFVGATVFSWGSRLSRGCTSGHGVSGMGIQSPASVLYVCGVFGAGIVTAYAEWFYRKRGPGSSSSKPKTL